MAIIYSYPLNDDIKPLDELVGTTEKNINGQLKTVTRNFLLQDLAEFLIVDGGLQRTITVTTNGTSGPSTLDQLTGILNIPEYLAGTVTSITALSPLTGGTILDQGSIGIQIASETQDGALSVVDWNTFNTKQTTIALTVNGTAGAATFNPATGALNIPQYASPQNLQSVTDLGSTTTNSITANSFVKSGGTSSQILVANGDVITAGNNITISGGTISSVGGGGGGGGVNYYLNGGTSQGSFGGTTYYEFSKTAVIGTGADFSINANGYIASFITDVADPSLLLIPGGNWNLEFYFSSSSVGGSPSFYTELYKYNGTTFTLIASSSTTPEGITGGTSIDAYFTSLAVPETILTVNDRLAIRVFVNHSSKTITLHTQDSHLCEVITTFTTGLTALNGLQAQVQNFATGTTGTDFTINSSGSTHTFNLPSASATARGVVTTGTQTFAGDKTFTGSIALGNVSATEIGYLNGVTSSIQNQFSQRVSLSGAQTIADTKTFTSSPLAPTVATGTNNTTVATTAFVTNSINSATPGTGYTVYNILITSTANITTQTTGTSGGISYVQNGRNVMINNSATAITVDVASAVTDFIASYTKIGTASIEFIGTGITFVNAINGTTLSGLPGSTALLVKNGNNVYLSINNLVV